MPRWPTIKAESTVMGANFKEITWEREGDCFRCTSHWLDRYGYPRAERDGKICTIARHILLRRHGKLPPSVVSRHTCDHRWCIRPDHITRGSNADNIMDKVQRGRWKGNTRLTSDQVSEIRALALFGELSQEAIGRSFGICQVMVSRIKLGKAWNK